MLFVYSLALFAVLVLGSPYWLFRMATSGKYRDGLAERLGAVPNRVRAALPSRGVAPQPGAGRAPQASGPSIVWVHAVSVGEVLAVSQLVQNLRAAKVWVLLSTTTRTGQRLARERFGPEHVFYFPLDFPFILRRYLRLLRPDLLVLAETEFWPNLLQQCRAARIPVAVVNARISDRSFPRYRRLRFLWRRILSALSLVLAQSPQDVDRLKAIGAPADRVLLGGNLKYDVRAVTTAPITAALREQLPPGAKLVVCGSTLEGEEQALLQLWPALVAAEPTLRMILAPRHPERFPSVAQLLSRSAVPWVQRSRWSGKPLAPGSILLLDSIGELASLYSLATVAFIGGSLVPAGGHNPLEPAQFAVPIVMGPHYENFRAVVEQLRQSDAIRIVDSAELAPTLTQLLRNPAEAAGLGSRALQVFRSESGATDRALQALLQLLERGPA